MFYPAALSDSSAKPTGLPFFTNLHLYRDAGLVEGRHPLVMLSHGRGSNPLQYAWFAETLASQGYIVAGLYHYRANTYDQSIAYLSNKIWQRPRDISSAMDFLLKDPVWGNAIDAQRIGVAGHSQGGFTSLWIGGAKVNADKFLAFQQGWKNNQLPDAKLVIIPGLVDHEIFINECDDEGRDEFPEACIDAPGIDRHAIHRDIGAAALTFFDAHLPSEGEK